jgi:NAD-dependent DNA ligase
MAWLISAIVAAVLVVWYKRTMSKGRDALEDPEFFKKYCERHGLDTFKEQKEFCERMNLDQSVISRSRDISKVNQPKSKPKKSLEICFTGFPESEKAGLYESAEAYGLTVRKDVTKYLDILCCGDSPGPVKVRKATEKGCMILSLEELITMLETGEVPEGV